MDHSFEIHRNECEKVSPFIYKIKINPHDIKMEYILNVFFDTIFEVSKMMFNI